MLVNALTNNIAKEFASVKLNKKKSKQNQQLYSNDRIKITIIDN